MVNPFDVHEQKRILSLAEEGILPEDFEQWWLPGRRKLAFATFTYGKGPGPQFKEWDLTDEQGRTMAHYAALHGKIPAGFGQWTLADKEGWSVAHEYAYRHVLPAEFPHWDLTDSRGQSVAYIAALKGNLPAGFDRWSIRTPEGASVAHVAACMQDLPSDFDQWNLVDEQGRTVREVFDKYETRRLGQASRGTGPKM